MKQKQSCIPFTATNKWLASDLLDLNVEELETLLAGRVQSQWHQTIESLEKGGRRKKKAVDDPALKV